MLFCRQENGENDDDDEDDDENDDDSDSDVDDGKTVVTRHDNA